MKAFNNLPSGTIIKKRYKISALIGSGHSSVVYQAFDMTTETEVALKLMDPLLSQDPVDVQRFLREVKILLSVNHPNIVTIYDVFRAGGTYCICMELIRGLDAKAHVKKNGPMAISLFPKFARQVLDAMASCHDRGIIHRDVKPHNIMIDEDQHVKLLDFGIAKMHSMSDLTKTGTSVGTPEYMAPELFLKGHSCDPRSDIYALGLVFYEVLAGAPLFNARDLSSLFQLHRTGERPSLTSARWEIPDWVDSIVMKCLHGEPGDRYQSVQEVLSDLGKGAMAHAHLQKETAPSLCQNCHQALLPHLSFCHQCGTFGGSGMSPGQYSVIIQDCGQHDLLAQFLEKSYAKVSGEKLKKKLRKPPVLLAKKISKDSAQRLGADLSLFPCRYTITDNLPGAFRLPDYYAAVALLVPLTLTLLSMSRTHALLLAALGSVACEALAFFLFKLKTSPAIHLKHQKKQAESDHKALDFSGLMQGVETPKFRTAIAHLLSRYFRIREKAGGFPGIEEELGTMEKVIESAVKSIQAAEEMLGPLNSTSIAELKERENRLEVQIENAQDAESSDKLIRMKTECLSHIKMYKELEDRYQSLFTSVIHANGALQQYEDALQDLSTEGTLNMILEKMDATHALNADFDPFT